MTTTSRDPDAIQDASTPANRATTGSSRWQQAVGVVGIVVVLWVGNNLFDTITSDGMGSGGGPGGHGPPDGAPTTQPNDGDDQAPVGGGDGGGHDPSQFDHG